MYYLFNKFNFSNPRWAVFSRVLAAIFGGYALATASSLFVAQVLLMSVGKYQAIHIGLLLTFAVYTGAVMWVFSVSTAKKAWVGLSKLVIFFLVGTWLLMKLIGVSS